MFVPIEEGFQRKSNHFQKESRCQTKRSISPGAENRCRNPARRKYGKISQSPERGMQDSPDSDNGIPNSRADAVPAKSGRLCESLIITQANYDADQSLRCQRVEGQERRLTSF